MCTSGCVHLCGTLICSRSFPVLSSSEGTVIGHPFLHARAGVTQFLNTKLGQTALRKRVLYASAGWSPSAQVEEGGGLGKKRKISTGAHPSLLSPPILAICEDVTTVRVPMVEIVIVKMAIYTLHALRSERGCRMVDPTGGAMTSSEPLRCLRQGQRRLPCHCSVPETHSLTHSLTR